MQMKLSSKILKGYLAVGMISVIVYSFALLLITNSPVYGAETSVNSVTGVNTGVYFYVSIDGNSQGFIPGDVSVSGYQGWIEGFQYSHSLYIPTDPNSGLPSGQRVHTPVIILKEIDKSSPKLTRALVTNEDLEVFIRFFNQSTYNYFTVHLQHAKIISIREFMPNSLNPSTYQPLMEEISLVYGTITWTWEEDGIEFTDSWVMQGG